VLRLTHGKTARGASSPADASILTKLQREEEINDYQQLKIRIKVPIHQEIWEIHI
jgi:hypothetical protein